MKNTSKKLVLISIHKFIVNGIYVFLHNINKVHSNIIMCYIIDKSNIMYFIYDLLIYNSEVALQDYG